MTKWIAFLAGASIALLALASWRVPANSPAFGAELSVRAVAGSGLSTSQADPFLTADDLRPGAAPTAGNVTLTNSSGASETFRMRANSDLLDLDRTLQIQATVDGAQIYSGTLGGLRNWTAASFALVPGQQVPLEVTLMLPAGATGYRDRIDEIDLEFKS